MRYLHDVIHSNVSFSPGDTLDCVYTTFENEKEK